MHARGGNGVVVRRVVRDTAIIGEGPVWDERLGRLLWLDIAQGLVHVTDPATRSDRVIDVGQPVGAIAPGEDGTYVAAARDGFGRLDVAAGVFELLASVERDVPSTRMNDGKVDPAGHFWAGTIAFDAQDGVLGERRPFATIDSSLGVPDGLTVDGDDHLWVAVWGGWCVLRFDPSGREVGRLPVPVAQPSSVTFGGPDLRDLFITTATEGLQMPDPAQPDAGSLFVCRPGPQGRPPRRFRWDVPRGSPPVNES